MKIYFSGASGVGIGPLAMIAKQAGFEVDGSDLEHSAMIDQLAEMGVDIDVGDQDGQHLRQIHDSKPIDHFVYSSALPTGHPELQAAKKLGINTIKRWDFINLILKETGMKMIAIAGTHGKTTTTAMLQWMFKQLDIEVSYSVGSTISWGPSGYYSPGCKYFIYEADEYDRNFLNFHPHLSLITAVDYDHPDSFPSPDDYDQAFIDFINQSNGAVLFDERFYQTYISDLPGTNSIDPDDSRLDLIQLAGLHNRQNALLAIEGALALGYGDTEQLSLAASSFPGTGRRFERISDNLYSDYAHTPEEIAATMQLASEIADGRKIVAVYEPHQNRRQHQIMDEGGYGDVFSGASRIIWMPTYLTREDDSQSVLGPNELIKSLSPPLQDIASTAEPEDSLLNEIKVLASDNKHLVIAMGAGPIHNWLTA